VTPARLKELVSATGSYFFTRSSMKFFGDTMHNYAVSSKPVTVTTPSGETVTVWELRRKRAVKHGLCSSAYFAIDDYRRVLAAPKAGHPSPASLDADRAAPLSDCSALCALDEAADDEAAAYDDDNKREND
jgi:hypothetical protein